MYDSSDNCMHVVACGFGMYHWCLPAAAARFPLHTHLKVCFTHSDNQVYLASYQALAQLIVAVRGFI